MTTPRLRSASVREKILFVAPRALNEPVTCSDSSCTGQLLAAGTLQPADRPKKGHLQVHSAGGALEPSCTLQWRDIKTVALDADNSFVHVGTHQLPGIRLRHLQKKNEVDVSDREACKPVSTRQPLRTRYGSAGSTSAPAQSLRTHAPGCPGNRQED